MNNMNVLENLTGSMYADDYMPTDGNLLQADIICGSAHKKLSHNLHIPLMDIFCLVRKL